MKAFIYTGGEIYPDGITERPSEGDLIVAADVGYRSALRLGVQPSLLLGDFDSLGEPSVPDTVELIRVPAEKDLTDTQLAVRTVIERGATSVTLIGGLSGRLDHTLSNLAILEDLHAHKIPAILTDGKNRARYLENGSTLIARSPHFRYLSLISVTPVSRGVTIEGCKYPLRNAKLSRSLQYAVSNELLSNCALISVKKGALWIIESGD